MRDDQNNKRPTLEELFGPFTAAPDASGPEERRSSSPSLRLLQGMQERRRNFVRTTIATVLSRVDMEIAAQWLRELAADLERLGVRPAVQEFVDKAMPDRPTGTSG